MSKTRVMIVDDHPPVLRVMRLSLEAAGFEVTSAANGVEALELLLQSEPDMLVTDIDMPKMTGKELCSEIVRRFPERRFSIVVLTARSELEHREWTRGMDNLQFMEKPVSMRGLVALISEACSTGSAEETAGA